MVGANHSVASGWDQGSEVRAWTSRTQSFSSRGLSINMGRGNFSAEPGFARLLQLQNEFGPRFYEEFSSLLQEQNPEMFFNGLLNFGFRLENQGKIELAAEVYSAIVGAGLVSAPPLHIREKAENQLNAILGKGSTGPRTEFLLRQFAEQATDPAAIFAMASGGIVYKATRLAALTRLLSSPTRNFFTSGFSARAAASLLGFAAEVPAFTLAAKLGNAALGRQQTWDVTSLSRELASGVIVLGSLKLSGWGSALVMNRLQGQASAGILRGGVQQGGMLGGILLGHRLEEAAGLREAMDGPATLMDSLVTLLHFNIGGQLARRALGENLRNWESRLDLQASRLSGGTNPQGAVREPPLQSAASVAGPFRTLSLSIETKDPVQRPFIVKSSSINEGGSDSQVTRLTERFRKVFPPQGPPETYSEEIIAASLRILCPIPYFKERLLEALSKTPNRGTLTQLYTVLALEDVFLANALTTSTGSFDYALLQMLVGQMMADENPARRLQSVGKLLEEMERGLSRDSLTRIAVAGGYGTELGSSIQHQSSEEYRARLGAHAVREWSDYPDQHRIQLFNFVYQTAGEHQQRAHRMIELFGQGRRDLRYHSFDLESALDFAAFHPFGKLALQRILHVFATGDIPEKITEIAAITPHPEILEHLGQLTLLKPGVVQNPEALALEINGTYHTGFFNDVRLSRKILAATYETLPYRLHPAKMEKAKQALETKLEAFLETGRRFDRDGILFLMGIDPDPAQRPQGQNWTNLVEVLPDAEFEQLVKRWGQAHDCNISLFVREKIPGGRQRILIRAMPSLDHSTPEGKARAYSEMINRLKGVVHETEHWRHFNGFFEGIEAPSKPLILSNISRMERLVSEIMAMLAESSWRMKNVDNDMAEIGRRLGLNLPLYLRNIADYTYNSRENERVSAQLEKLP